MEKRTTDFINVTNALVHLTSYPHIRIMCVLKNFMNKSIIEIIFGINSKPIKTVLSHKKRVIRLKQSKKYCNQKSNIVD